jgi:hypothetical protein
VVSIYSRISREKKGAVKGLKGFNAPERLFTESYGSRKKVSGKDAVRVSRV